MLTVKTTLRLITCLLSLSLPTLVTASAASSLYDISLSDIDGNTTTLAAHKGEVMLLVNVASKCGNTPQYADLEALYQQYQERGFVVLGFPCNQFGGQEPGSNEEIKAFCSLHYQVTFPMFDKLEVNGEGRHDLYTALSGEGAPFPGKIGWNFEKFLVNRDGKTIARFAPGMSPREPEIIAAIEAALSK